jgi:hypothetical protein
MSIALAQRAAGGVSHGDGPASVAASMLASALASTTGEVHATASTDASSSVGCRLPLLTPLPPLLLLLLVPSIRPPPTLLTVDMSEHAEPSELPVIANSANPAALRMRRRFSRPAALPCTPPV